MRLALRRMAAQETLFVFLLKADSAALGTEEHSLDLRSLNDLKHHADAVNTEAPSGDRSRELVEVRDENARRVGVEVDGEVRMLGAVDRIPVAADRHAASELPGI